MTQWGRRREFIARGMKCRSCGKDLTSVRRCKDVVLKCSECGKEFSLKDYSEAITDSFEEEMAFVPMDRL